LARPRATTRLALRSGTARHGRAGHPISGEPDIEVVAEASNGIEAVDKAVRFRPTVVLMEIRMPELDVFRLIARGLSNSEIGQELYITDTTVKKHITHIRQKLNLRDRVQAVVLAHETCLFAADAQPASRRDERPAP
jgi:DNA-binding NarL/FixJ family response regulator